MFACVRELISAPVFPAGQTVHRPSRRTTTEVSTMQTVNASQRVNATQATSEQASNHDRSRWTAASVAETCGVCLSGPVVLEPFGELCHHRFCAECLRRCESSGHSNCPVCRAARRATQQLPVQQPSAQHEHLGALEQSREFRDFACIAHELRSTPFELSTSILVFDSSRHGYNLNTLRQRLLNVSAALVLLQDADGEKYGVFTGFPWCFPVTKPYGTHNAFLFFSSSSVARGRAVVWRAESSNNVMYSRPDFVAFGSTSDGRGYGLEINSSLSVARFARSDTFDNVAMGTVNVKKVLAIAWGLPQHQEMIQFGAADGGRAEAAMLLGLGAARAQAARDWFS